MANPHAVGRRGEPFQMEIELGKVREFARATLSESPCFWAEDQPVIPPTFLTTHMIWQPIMTGVWREVELNQQRGLHAEQEFVFHGPPPRVGDSLVATSQITDVYTKPGSRGDLTFAVMTTSFHDPSGRLVAESRLVGVEAPLKPRETS